MLLFFTSLGSCIYYSFIDKRFEFNSSCVTFMLFNHPIQIWQQLTTLLGFPGGIMVKKIHLQMPEMQEIDP